MISPCITEFISISYITSLSSSLFHLLQSYMNIVHRKKNNTIDHASPSSFCSFLCLPSLRNSTLTVSTSCLPFSPPYLAKWLFFKAPKTFILLNPTVYAQFFLYQASQKCCRRRFWSLSWRIIFSWLLGLYPWISSSLSNSSTPMSLQSPHTLTDLC